MTIEGALAAREGDAMEARKRIVAMTDKQYSLYLEGIVKELVDGWNHYDDTTDRHYGDYDKICDAVDVAEIILGRR